MPEVIVGGICFSAGIFAFGWTGYDPNIPWFAPTLSGVLIGFGLLSIFLQGLNYLVDAYLMVSNCLRLSKGSRTLVPTTSVC